MNKRKSEISYFKVLNPEIRINPEVSHPCLWHLIWVCPEWGGGGGGRGGGMLNEYAVFLQL